MPCLPPQRPGPRLTRPVGGPGWQRASSLEVLAPLWHPGPWAGPRWGGAAGRGQLLHFFPFAAVGAAQTLAPGVAGGFGTGVSCSPSSAPRRAQGGRGFQGCELQERAGLPMCHWQPGDDREATPRRVVSTDGLHARVSRSRASDCPVAALEAPCSGPCLWGPPDELAAIGAPVWVPLLRLVGPRSCPPLQEPPAQPWGHRCRPNFPQSPILESSRGPKVPGQALGATCKAEDIVRALRGGERVRISTTHTGGGGAP